MLYKEIIRYLGALSISITYLQNRKLLAYLLSKGMFRNLGLLNRARTILAANTVVASFRQ